MREGFRSIEHVKRYTTTGMATDQGKTSNINGLAIAAEALERPTPEVGLTTFRPPYTPVTFGAFAGHNRGDAVRPDAQDADRMPGPRSNGAVFEDCRPVEARLVLPAGRRGHARGGGPRMPGGARLASACSTPRRSARSRSSGPDAAEFLNRIYTNAWTKLAARPLPLRPDAREDGFIFDDGVIGRLAQDRFHVTTTTGGAARVLAMMEDYLQTEWPELEGLADLDHRAMGGDRRARAEGPRS